MWLLLCRPKNSSLQIIQYAQPCRSLHTKYNSAGRFLVLIGKKNPDCTQWKRWPETNRFGITPEKVISTKLPPTTAASYTKNATRQGSGRAEQGKLGKEERKCENVNMRHRVYKADGWRKQANTLAETEMTIFSHKKSRCYCFGVIFPCCCCYFTVFMSLGCVRKVETATCSKIRQNEARDGIIFVATERDPSAVDVVASGGEKNCVSSCETLLNCQATQLIQAINRDKMAIVVFY